MRYRRVMADYSVSTDDGEYLGMVQLPGPDWDGTATQYRPWVTEPVHQRRRPRQHTGPWSDLGRSAVRRSVAAPRG